MANDLLGNPLLIDTAGATVLRSGPKVIRRIKWTGATTAGHVATVQAGGRTIWSCIANTTNFASPVDEINVTVKEGQDLTVSALSSGTLLIYLD